MRYFDNNLSASAQTFGNFLARVAVQLHSAEYFAHRTD
jgi:hypothetical protein